MKSILFIVCALAVGGCRHKQPAESSTLNPPPSALYEEAADRLLAMLDDGWVVSRAADGTAHDVGDSLIFTGIAMGALDCQRGTVIESALLKMLRDKNGGVYRHPTIPDDYSLDGLLGLWWGIKERTGRCPDSRGVWAEILPRHKAAVSVEPFFATALQEVMADLGVDSKPSVADRGVLGSEIAGWAVGVVTQKRAAFRLHLGWLALSLVDAPKGKAAYCEAVPEAKIALLENFCGRGGLSDWVSAFQYDRYFYAFQKAAWQGPDGDGLKNPAVDLLVALHVLYP